MAENVACRLRIHAHCQELKETDAPTHCFFFDLEWRQVASKVLDHFKAPESQVIADLGEVHEHTVTFNHDLFAAKPL